ncbi:PiggyBac transposable element-derived protein 3 [Trichinella papuae]|uniref:PiggyBac transposable element-derived protein 3 n=1 Tax=Trichinella papuae TaxID=268474 RepID=A0A0V1N8C6_9BILA|nr:PiggyBac transposable element-derived protein 3 [Trichinella papuae]
MNICSLGLSVVTRFLFPMRCCIQNEEKQAIDEQIIPFKRKHKLKIFTPRKPRRWGFKLFSRCGISGILYDFAFYELCRPKVEKSVGFVSGDFLRLKEEGMWTCETIRSNRLRGCPFMSEQALKVSGRGTTDFRTTRARDIIAVAWYDNRRVTLTSTYLGVKPVKLKPRWDRKQHKRESWSRCLPLCTTTTCTWEVLT